VKCPEFAVVLSPACILLPEAYVWSTGEGKGKGRGKGALKIEDLRDVILTLVADVMFISTTEGATPHTLSKSDREEDMNDINPLPSLLGPPITADVMR
jgi:hypothetical protein